MNLKQAFPSATVGEAMLAHDIAERGDIGQTEGLDGSTARRVLTMSGFIRSQS